MTDEFDEEWATPFDWAKLYWDLGWQPIPCQAVRHDGGQWKVPALKNWKHLQLERSSPEEFAQMFPQTYNGNLICAMLPDQICVDLDLYKGPEAGSWWDGLLAVHNNGMEIETVEQVTGGGGRQIFFRIPERYRDQFKNMTNLVPNVDIRAGGRGYVVVPPSGHDRGGHYAWVNGRGPHECTLEEMPEWMCQEILRRQGDTGNAPSDVGTRSTPLPTSNTSVSIDGRVTDGREAFMTHVVWGALTDLRQLNAVIPEDGFAHECAEAYGRYESKAKPRQGTRADGTDSERLEREGRGWTAFREKWAKGLAQWDTKLASHAANPTTPVDAPPERDPDFEPAAEPPAQIARDAPPLSPPEGAAKGGDNADDLKLADPFEDAVVPDFPTGILPPKLDQLARDMAMAMGTDTNLVSMATLISCGASLSQSIRLKMRTGGTFYVRPCLWGIAVGPPSSLKTPVFTAIFSRLADLDTNSYKAYAKAMAQWKELPKDERGPEPDKPPRYLMEDTTVEKLQDVVAGQTRGTALLIEEMSKFSASSKGSRGGLSDSDRSIYTRAFDGNRYVIDRMGRGTVIADPFSVTLVGGIQPNALPSITHLGENGFLQRMLVIIMGERVESQAISYDVLLNYLGDLQERLTTVVDQDVTCTPEAEQILMDFENRLIGVMKYTDTSDAFKSALGKMPGYSGRIALILHFMYRMEGTRLAAETAQRAVDLLWNFCIPHLMAFYEMCDDTTGIHRTRKLAKWILACDLDRITVRDLTVHVKWMRGKGSSEITSAMGALVAMGWLKEEVDEKSRAVKAWLVNVNLRSAFAERRIRAQEERTKAYAAVRDMQVGGGAKRIAEDQGSEEKYDEGDDFG